MQSFSCEFFSQIRRETLVRPGNSGRLGLWGGEGYSCGIVPGAMASLPPLPTTQLLSPPRVPVRTREPLYLGPSMVKVV